MPPAGQGKPARRPSRARLRSCLFEAAPDVTSDFLAALGTSLCLFGFSDAIYAAALDRAAVLDKPPD